MIAFNIKMKRCKDEVTKIKDELAENRKSLVRAELKMNEKLSSFILSNYEDVKFTRIQNNRLTVFDYNEEPIELEVITPKVTTLTEKFEDGALYDYTYLYSRGPLDSLITLTDNDPLKLGEVDDRYSILGGIDGEGTHFNFFKDFSINNKDARIEKFFSKDSIYENPMYENEDIKKITFLIRDVNLNDYDITKTSEINIQNSPSVNVRTMNFGLNFKLKGGQMINIDNTLWYEVTHDLSTDNVNYLSSIPIFSTLIYTDSHSAYTSNNESIFIEGDTLVVALY